MRLIDGNDLSKNIISKYFPQGIVLKAHDAAEKCIIEILSIIRLMPIFTFDKIVMPKLKQANDIWHNVKEELPPNRTSVLCYFIYENGHGAMAENHYFGNGKWLSNGNCVAYWRSLPDLPDDVVIEQFDEKTEEDDEE